MRNIRGIDLELLVTLEALLTAGARGMRPTTRGLELLAPLREALSGVERMLSAQTPFDPARTELTWRVVASDYAQHAILMPLLAQLRRDAPGVRVAVYAPIPAEIAR